MLRKIIFINRCTSCVEHISHPLPHPHTLLSPPVRTPPPPYASSCTFSSSCTISAWKIFYTKMLYKKCVRRNLCIMSNFCCKSSAWCVYLLRIHNMIRQNKILRSGTQKLRIVAVALDAFKYIFRLMWDIWVKRKFFVNWLIFLIFSYQTNY